MGSGGSIRHRVGPCPTEPNNPWPVLWCSDFVDFPEWTHCPRCDPAGHFHQLALHYWHDLHDLHDFQERMALLADSETLAVDDDGVVHGVVLPMTEPVPLVCIDDGEPEPKKTRCVRD